MEALINKLKDYRNTLSEKEANIIRTLLKRIKYDGGYIYDTVSKLQSKIGHPKEHKRILALGYMIEVLEYRLKPWYKRNPFLFKRGLNLN